MLTKKMLNKARQDPFFQSVIKHFGESELIKAGFFDDGTDLSVDMADKINPSLLVTPLRKIIQQFKNNPDYIQKFPNAAAVLISSGGFCPLHAGHMQMMQSAKIKLEQQGYFVAGGFFCPDHDQYVYKKCGPSAQNAVSRITFAEKLTEQSSWLDVDSWAASYLDRAVNYSDIIRRLKNYLSTHIKDKKIEVFFVCGADNADFYKAFIDQGCLVIVPRKGHDLDLDSKRLAKSKIFIADQHTANDLCSTNIRLEYKNIESEQLSLKHKNYRIIKIFIRDEGTWAIEPWIEKFGNKVIDAKVLFQSDLSQIINKFFSQTYPEAATSVMFLSVEQQHVELRKLLQNSEFKTISIDPCTQADFNLKISRIFSVTDSSRQSGLFNRPDYQDLRLQISTIPDGEYDLVEDDIATSTTISELIKLLPDRIKIRKIIALNQLSTNENLATVEANLEDRLLDVVDLRDFIVGSRDAGLVVELPDDSVVRAPYLLPYVRNNSRMSLPVCAEREFSQKLWKANLEFFESLDNQVQISDCNQSFQKLARYVGFAPETKITEFCKWHIREL